MLKEILKLRDAGAVKRMHTMRTLGTQDLAAHSWGVAMLVLAFRPYANAALLRAALVHDLHEHETGDVPAPVKWKSPVLEEALRGIEQEWDKKHGTTVNGTLSSEERQLLKWCDSFELALHCFEEYKMGNRYALSTLDRILENMKPRSTSEQHKLINELHKEIGYVTSE